MKVDALRHTKGFELAYKIGVAIKGIDGAIELLSGLALLLSPTIIHETLMKVHGVAVRHEGHLYNFFAEYVARLDNDLAKSGLTFLIIFLIGHGVVKLVLVYCLIRRIVWAYPYALTVLGLFLIYQIFVLVENPASLGMWALTVLDTAIIWLVWGEWKDLREKVAAEPVRKKSSKTV